MSDTLFEIRPDGVGLITLNRPERLNSMGGELMPLLAKYIEEAENSRDVRCIALTGSGRAFCAGGDVGNMQSRNSTEALPQAESAQPENPIGRLERQIDGLRESHNATSLRLHHSPKPTVALVNGYAVGAGMSLALACDIRFCSENAKFGTAFKNIGLSGDYGGSYFLQRMVGPGRARELYFTAEIIDAQRALELGIANRVEPAETFMEEGLAFCARLAAGPTGTYARMKQNLNLAENAPLQTILDQEAHFQRTTGMSADSREAVKAFLEKREPRFVGE